MVREPAKSGTATSVALPHAGHHESTRAGHAGQVYFEPLHIERDGAHTRQLTGHASLVAGERSCTSVDLSRTYHADTPRRAELEELVRTPGVREAIETACRQSFEASSDEPVEQGGWIVRDDVTGALDYEPSRSSLRGKDHVDALLGDLPRLADEGKTVLALFHTHLNQRCDGFDVIQSPEDVRTARVLGVPGIIGTREGMVYFDGDSAPGRRQQGFFGPDRQAGVSLESRIREAIGRCLLAAMRGLHEFVEKLPRW